MSTARKTALRPNDRWMTVLEASQVLGESRMKVLNRSLKGELIAEHIAGRACVLRESVEKLLRERE